MSTLQPTKIINGSQLTGPVTIAAQQIYSDSSTQLHNIGEFAYTNDGRGFRYCKVGATALAAGKLYQSPAQDATNFHNLSVAVNSVNDTAVVTTTTVTLTVNQVAGGFLLVTAASTGAGFTYKILSHAAATGAVVTFNLSDPIAVATTGSPTIDVHPNPYNGVIVDPTTATSSPVGVAVFNVASTDFGWLQTHGPVGVLAQGALAVGENIVAANSTSAGAVAATSGVLPPIGYALTDVTSTNYGIVFLKID